MYSHHSSDAVIPSFQESGTPFPICHNFFGFKDHLFERRRRGSDALSRHGYRLIGVRSLGTRFRVRVSRVWTKTCMLCNVSETPVDRDSCAGPGAMLRNDPVRGFYIRCFKQLRGALESLPERLPFKSFYSTQKIVNAK